MTSIKYMDTDLINDISVSVAKPLPVSGTFTGSSASVGTTGAAVPTSADLVGWKDGSGNLQPVSAANPLPVTEGRGSTFAPAQVSVTTTATQILAVTTLPSGRIVRNMDTTATMFIGPSGVTPSNGFPVYAGESFDASHTSAAIYGIVSTGSVTAAGVQY